jgi:hypothetical protein
VKLGASFVFCLTCILFSAAALWLSREVHSWVFPRLRNEETNILHHPLRNLLTHAREDEYVSGR